MFYNVQKEMVNMNDAPSVDDIKQFLEYCDSSLKAKLAEISTLEEVIRVIRDNCSLINIVILEAVVEQFEITGAQKYIDNYKRIIMESCKNLSVPLGLNESFDTVKTSPPLKCETATYTLGWEPDEHKLKDIIDILSKTSGTTQQLNEATAFLQISQKDKEEQYKKLQEQLDDEKHHREKERNIQQQVLDKYEKEMHEQRKELIEKEERIGTLTQQLNEATAFLQQSQKDKEEQNEQLQELKSS